MGGFNQPDVSPCRLNNGVMCMHLFPDPFRDHRLQVEPDRDRQHARLLGQTAEGGRELRRGRPRGKDGACPQKERRPPQRGRRSEEVVPGGGNTEL